MCMFFCVLGWKEGKSKSPGDVQDNGGIETIFVLHLSSSSFVILTKKAYSQKLNSIIIIYDDLAFGNNSEKKHPSHFLQKEPGAAPTGITEQQK